MDIKQAIQQVNRDYYVLQENGKLLPQTTSTEGIEKGLHMLNVQIGQRVLEIGTGSGYSTALLATLVGESGQVTSVDKSTELTERLSLNFLHFLGCIVLQAIAERIMNLMPLMIGSSLGQHQRPYLILGRLN